MPTPTDQPNPTFRTIYLPTPGKFKPWYTSFIFLLVLTLPMTAVAFLVLNVSWRFSSLSFDSWWRVGLVGLAFAALATTVLNAVAWLWPSRLPLRNRTYRTQRLEALAAHPDFAARLPHRLVELSLRLRPEWLVSKKWIMAQLRPEDTIVIQPHDVPPLTRPNASNVPFEPAGVVFRGDELNALASLHLGDEKEPGDATALERELHDAHKLINVPEAPFWITGIVIMLCVVGWAPRWYRWAAGFGVLLLIRAISVFFGLPYPFMDENTRWWIVPGGLCYHKRGLWKRTRELGLIARRESPLVIDYRRGTAYVQRDGQPRTITNGPMACWAILAGWMSTARTPTLEEVRSLLDPDDAT